MLHSGGHVLEDQQIIPSSKNTPIEAAEGEIVESFYLSIPGDCLAMTNSGKEMVEPTPPGIPVLSEPEISNNLVALMKVRDGDGNLIGLASQLESFGEAEPTDEGPPAWDTYATLMIPGRGTLLLHHAAVMPDAARAVVGPIMAAKEDWQGKITFVTSVGPLANGRGRIAGGTGEFEKVSGSFVEIARTTKFTAAGEMHLTPIELRLFKENV